MAQQVKIAGALFENVPSISVPDANDVWHAFTDTSDADAVAADLASGKTAYAGGVKLVGTGELVEVEPLPVTANGTYTAQSGHAYSPVTVNVEGGGGGGGSMSDPIRFFDYDGTLVASYSAVPSELPDVPTHEGLVDGTWNYTLAEVGEQFAAVGRCDVGANFSTESGATEIDVEFVDAAMLSPYLRFAVNGRVSIDWGDGSPATTASNGSLTKMASLQHVYPAPGAYTIKITPLSGRYAMFGSNVSPVLNGKMSTWNGNVVYANCVRSVRVAAGCIIGDYAFMRCNLLKSVSLPGNLETIGVDAFSYCHSLQSISIPRSVASIGYECLRECHCLNAVSIPVGVTSISTNFLYTCTSLSKFAIPFNTESIGSSICNSCSSLVEVTIPSGVTRIGTNAFQYCYGIAAFRCKPTVPPTVDNANAFTGIPSGCKFYVPYSADHSVLEAYKAATNWSTYASRMVEEPQS